MAGTLRAAVAASPPPPSPLPPSRGATASGGIPWLLRKRASKVRHGPPLGGQEPDVHDEVELEDEGATFVLSTPSAADAVGAGGGTPEPSGKRREALARLRSAVLAVVARARRRRGRRPMGSSVTGTIFGRRRGRVHLALQTDPRTPPALMVELAAYSTGALVREMSSGLVRIALECEKTPTPADTGGERERRRTALVEEPTWRAYCNGRKCGYAVRRECGAEEWRLLRAVEPVSVGAGVVPDGGAGEGDLMYMRARFERVVGSRDSEAFYMINPDGNGGPELSIYLLRV
ncbi:protein MIZU-KUSSEI 1-like [Triticum dicoccoides]|uniref:protein MIZU-KUSSEI 1-like n=1 Tax=Triticum dicoccoides TaxID=85692 RepID=UPI001891DDB8|nr:protein MIZU-KUSSEI 1-like [Triticum dicoccoides]